jgi:hypothetical protein
MRAPLLLLVLFLFATGCDSAEPTTPSTPEQVRVDLQWNFDGDHVAIELDGDLVFSDRVTTNHLLGIARFIDLSIPKGEHSIQAVVNGRYHAAAQFMAGDVVVVAVRFTEGRDAVEIELSDQFYAYD